MKAVMHRTVTVLATSTLLWAVAATPAQASTSEYVRFVRSELPELRSVSSSSIVKLGRLVCKGLNNGLDPLDIGEVLMESDFDEEQTATFVVGAIYFICPKHKWQLD